MSKRIELPSTKDLGRDWLSAVMCLVGLGMYAFLALIFVLAAAGAMKP